MEILAITGMLGAALCWLLPPRLALPDERALEWQLLGVPLAASALLIWLEGLGAGGLVRWGGCLGAIAVLDSCARCAVALCKSRHRRDPSERVESTSDIDRGPWFGLDAQGSEPRRRKPSPLTHGRGM